MNQKPASFGVRLLADFFDFMILTVPATLVFSGIIGDDTSSFARSWGWHVSYTLYLTLVPLVWKGYIIGKRLFKINVNRMDNGDLTLKNMVLREVGGKFLLTYLTLGISNVVSTFMVIFRSDKRAIHDFIGGTYVRHNN